MGKLTVVAFCALLSVGCGDESPQSKRQRLSAQPGDVVYRVYLRDAQSGACVELGKTQTFRVHPDADCEPQR